MPRRHDARSARDIRHLCDGLDRLEGSDEAEGWRRKWAAAVRAKEGPDSAAYARALKGLGENLIRRQKHKDAEPVLRECLAILQKQKPDAVMTFEVQSWLGTTLLRQRDYDEAEPLLLRAVHGLREAKPEEAHHHFAPATGDRLTETIDSLIALYRATGRADQAARWEKEAEELKTANGPKPK